MSKKERTGKGKGQKESSPAGSDNTTPRKNANVSNGPRDVTRLLNVVRGWQHGLAQSGGQDLPYDSVVILREDLDYMETILERMDARTGRPDPTKRLTDTNRLSSDLG